MDQTAAGQAKRIRGRKAVKLRRARLRAEPLCRHCMAKGRWTLATVPDHIVPLDHGGKEDGRVVSRNIQCLCAECHDAKTRDEFGMQPRQWTEPKPPVPIGADGCPIDW